MKQKTRPLWGGFFMRRQRLRIGEMHCQTGMRKRRGERFTLRIAEDNALIFLPDAVPLHSQCLRATI